jgi:hypothetical protein
LPVAKENGDAPALDHHIRVMGVLWIKKAQRHGDEIGIDASETRAQEEPSMGGIVARQLNDLNLAVIVDGDKMGRLAGLLLPHESIGLEGARSPILPIIERELYPPNE